VKHREVCEVAYISYKVCLITFKVKRRHVDCGCSNKKKFLQCYYLCATSYNEYSRIIVVTKLEHVISH